MWCLLSSLPCLQSSEQSSRYQQFCSSPLTSDFGPIILRSTHFIHSIHSIHHLERLSEFLHPNPTRPFPSDTRSLHLVLSPADTHRNIPHPLCLHSMHSRAAQMQTAVGQSVYMHWRHHLRGVNRGIRLKSQIRRHKKTDWTIQ
jgi:hypothetical protein